ncbi:MAG: hypothetical protein PVJ95_09125 [Cellvibrionales bacterium]
MKKDKVLEANQLATIAANLLNQGILEADRTTAKRIFRELEVGRKVTLTHLRMEDGGTTRMDLALDARSFNGNLNFSAWRDGVLALVARISDDLRTGKALPVFRPLDTEEGLPESEQGLNLIGSIGGTNHDGIVNAIMLGLSPDPEKPVVTFSLVYVDPDQFSPEASASSTS